MSGISTSGTSVKGWQGLATGIRFPVEQVYFRVDSDEVTRPRRVGYMYVMLQNPSATAYTSVIDARLIYSPGIYFDTPSGLGASTDIWMFVANWNFSGLGWDLYA